MKCCTWPFETKPLSNPPKETYYRRAVYQIALARLSEIELAITGHDTKHTGKVYRNVHGEAIGRGRGIMPSLQKSFPEIRYWSKGPAALLQVLREKKRPMYFSILEAAVNQVEGTSGEQLELFVRRAPAAELAELPPVVYPPHTGNRRCKHCRKPHASALHRFHLRGSFDRSHMDKTTQRERAADRAERRARLAGDDRDAVPF